MNDRAGLWLVRGALMVIAAVLLWWGAIALDLGGSLSGSARAHASEHHGGAANKLSAGGDVLSEVVHVFGCGALVLGAGAAIAAVFPYRRLKAKAVERG